MMTMIKSNIVSSPHRCISGYQRQETELMTFFLRFTWEKKIPPGCRDEIALFADDILHFITMKLNANARKFQAKMTKWSVFTHVTSSHIGVVKR